MRAGLGFDEADVGVVLNVTADHLGLRGINTVEQLAEVKSVIASVVKREGHVVLNADDPLVYPMRYKTGADVVLFSVKPDGENPEMEDHITRGGIAVRIEDATFVIRRGRLRIPIATLREVPLMMGVPPASSRATSWPPSRPRTCRGCATTPSAPGCFPSSRRQP